MRYTFTFRSKGTRRKALPPPQNQIVLEVVDGYSIVIFRNGYKYKTYQYDNFEK